VLLGAEDRSRLEFSAFRAIAERNIFNGSRAGRRTEPPRESRRPARVDSFGLVGVMSYDRGTFAFFDGSSADYRKALQCGGGLAGFELVEVLPNAVKLQQGTNTTELRLGMQLRREDEGEWKLAEQGESFASSGSARGGSSERGSSREPSPGGGAAGSPAAASAVDDEVLKRMLQKRQEENP
jgi:hypothetical protein